MLQPHLNEDFQDFLQALQDEKVIFLIVGAYALAIHGVPRATGDLDIWIKSDPDNAKLVWKALQSFGAPVKALDVSIRDLATKGMVVQIGLPPRRIDLLTDISGVTFEEAWQTRVLHEVGSLTVPFIGRRALLQNKKASGRPKDLVDLATLEQNKHPAP